MSQEKVGHSTNKAFPYAGIDSLQLFPNRVDPTLTPSKQVVLTINPEVYPDVDFESAEAMRDFAFFRLHDYHQALLHAEDQIRAMLTENPFIPEEFCFEQIHKPQSIHESPVRIYQSILDPSISIHRKAGLEDPSLWMLMKKDKDGNFNSIEVRIPNHRIAYALFYAMQIPMEMPEAQDNGEIVAPSEYNPFQDPRVTGKLGNFKLEKEDTKGLRKYDVTFIPKNKNGHLERLNKMVFPGIHAADESDAMTRTKFMVETDPENKDKFQDTTFDQYIAREVK